jgi:hypothetical protein
LRLQKPVLALTSQQGDTAALLRSTGGATIVDIADEDAIYRTLPQFLQSIHTRAHPLPELVKVRAFSRREQTATLASCLDVVVEETLRQQSLNSPSRGERQRR